MLDDLGSSLGAVLRDRLPADTMFRFDPPEQSWSGSEATIGLFLHRVLANSSDGSAALWTEDRDATGRVSRRTSPERLYDFYYLVTAWGTGADQELALLGGVLSAVANDGLVPVTCLAGSLAETRSPVTVTVGAPTGVPEIWAALGLRPRTCLDLVVTAAVAPIAQTELAPPPDVLELGVDQRPGSAGLGSAREPHPEPRRPTARITEGGRRGQSGSQVG
ncbi:Pvc16 family protein [Kribbella monticola]|uniref:Pvc16 family protein n=1 Tax=Kribbella monticola TaxID=2185285 RepID=UPI000DD2E8C8|nr:Pvc16 family protein [Kribbella monticola]